MSLTGRWGVRIAPPPSSLHGVTLRNLEPTLQPPWGGDGSSRMTAKIKPCPVSFWGCCDKVTQNGGRGQQELLSQSGRWTSEVRVSGGHDPPECVVLPGGRQASACRCVALSSAPVSLQPSVSLFCLLTGTPARPEGHPLPEPPQQVIPAKAPTRNAVPSSGSGTQGSSGGSRCHPPRSLSGWHSQRAGARQELHESGCFTQLGGLPSPRSAPGRTQAGRAGAHPQGLRWPGSQSFPPSGRSCPSSPSLRSDDCPEDTPCCHLNCRPEKRQSGGLPEPQPQCPRRASPGVSSPTLLWQMTGEQLRGGGFTGFAHT